MQPLYNADEDDALEQIIPGSDGVTLEYGHHRGTFLPQVWKQLSSAREFIAHLKLKCGLPADFWTSEFKLYRYTVQKWGERNLPHTNDPRAG
jgi:AMMECR1 domain-containing protein